MRHPRFVRGASCGVLFGGICQVDGRWRGEEREREFVRRVWQVEDGLPQNSVLAVLQAREGYLWLGTANGLARFDGVRFKVFGLADGLPGLLVRVLLEDREGTLWIGTGSGFAGPVMGALRPGRPATASQATE